MNLALSLPILARGRKVLILCSLISLSLSRIHAGTDQSNNLQPVSPQSAVVSIFRYDSVGFLATHGAGFFVSSDGLIATARHMVQDSSDIRVRTSDGQTLPALGVVAEDPSHDLVIIRIKGTGYPFLPLGSFDQVQPGSEINVVCDQYGFQGKTINGSVANVENLADDYRWFGIDAIIEEGESGSPVLDKAGRVAGMIRAWLGDRSKGFVVPVDSIKQMLNLASAAKKPQPVAELEKRDYVELYDDPDLEPSLKALSDGDSREAARRMQLVCGEFPKSAAAYALLGSYYSRLGMRKEANGAFTKAINIRPDYAFALASLAMTLAYQGKGEEAWNMVKRATEAAAGLDSHFPDITFNIGATCILLNQYEPARTAINLLRQFKTPEANGMADKLSQALTIATRK